MLSRVVDDPQGLALGDWLFGGARGNAGDQDAAIGDHATQGLQLGGGEASPQFFEHSRHIGNSNF
jgi:hypothetical protein